MLNMFKQGVTRLVMLTLLAMTLSVGAQLASAPGVSAAELFEVIAAATDPSNIAAVVTTLVALGAALSTIFPSVSRNPIFNFALKVINFVGLNFGKAKNADDTS